MARPDDNDATATDPARDRTREELKRTLERDTAVQGEETQTPAPGAGSEPPMAPDQAPGRRQNPA